MNEYQNMAKIFKAFCDESRLAIIASLQNGEKCACDLLENLSISQSTLSHHMKILVDSDVVQSRKEGKWTYYAIDYQGFNRAIEYLNSMSVQKSIIERKCCNDC